MRCDLRSLAWNSAGQLAEALALHAGFEMDAGAVTGTQPGPEQAAEHLVLPLERDGDQYRNAVQAETFLSRRSPSYSGGLLEMLNDRLYPFWGRLEEALRTGHPQNEAREGGSFFERVPAGGDAYLLSHVIHDWSEAQCLTILGHCRRAMNPGGRLLLIEMVLPPGNTPHPGKVLDMMMLVGPGGRERTEQEYATLLAQAEFPLTRVVPTECAVSIVEAVAA